MSVDYLVPHPMVDHSANVVDHSAKVVDMVASYYCCTRDSSSGQLFTGSWVATVQLILCVPC